MVELLDIKFIEAELRQRTRYKYEWDRKQTNDWDSLTNYVYRIRAFNDVLTETKQRFAHREDYKRLGGYAVNRWFNFWSAQAVEAMFESHPIVTPAENSKDRFCDFFIHDIPFDLKTTVFP